jgi:hypothetical protein
MHDVGKHWNINIAKVCQGTNKHHIRIISFEKCYNIEGKNKRYNYLSFNSILRFHRPTFPNNVKRKNEKIKKEKENVKKEKRERGKKKKIAESDMAVES